MWVQALAGTEVYLLGAGFARAISPRMPLLQGLSGRVLAQRQLRRLVPPAVVTMMEENFAHALSYLEQAKPWVSEADNLRHRALFLEFSNAIARDLEATGAEVARQLGERVPHWLQRLVRHWHRHRSVVLTLNYDTLVETIAAAVPVNDHPVTAEQLYPPLLTDAGQRASGSVATPRQPSFRLLKLHGSINWYYSGRQSAQGEPIYFVPPLPLTPLNDEERRLHEFRLNAVSDKYPFLVPPVYDKTSLLTHETIRALWFEAGDALRHTKRFVCMGYSLPESDLTMKHFLGTVCAGEREIVVVDPARKAARNFERVFRGAPTRITPYARGERSIERFVQEYIRLDA
jgi:hypothetical protein